MAFAKSEVAFGLATAIALLAATASAQNAPRDFVRLHNQARAADGVGPVAWDTVVARYAQAYAARRAGDCRLLLSGGPYGENLYRGSAGRAWTAADAVRRWAAQKAYYHYDTNTCDPGMRCGAYTQVAWSNSTRIGCAARQGVFIICSYDPPGNFKGQRPFTIARP